jgi:hypothetical protein
MLVCRNSASIAHVTTQVVIATEQLSETKIMHTGHQPRILEVGASAGQGGGSGKAVS